MPVLLNLRPARFRVVTAAVFQCGIRFALDYARLSPVAGTLLPFATLSRFIQSR